MFRLICVCVDGNFDKNLNVILGVFCEYFVNILISDIVTDIFFETGDMIYLNAKKRM